MFYVGETINYDSNIEYVSNELSVTSVERQQSINTEFETHQSVLRNITKLWSLLIYVKIAECHLCVYIQGRFATPK